jgi:translation initiation factor 2 alpha subunit (eIF-2alpha)
MKEKPKESDLLLCTVTKIEGATVFVEISGSKIPGSIILPEVSAGRIRNIRDFVSPGKKIVCKVLKSLPDHIELTLRRVTAKERDLVLEKNKKSLTAKKIISTVSSPPDEIIKKIESSYDLSEFIDEARESPSILSKFFSEEESKKLQKILKEKSSSAKEIKKIFSLKSTSSSGLSEIKSVLSPYNSQISYLGSGSFSLIISSPNFKQAEAEALEILENIEKQAKTKSISFSQKDKK